MSKLSVFKSRKGKIGKFFTIEVYGCNQSYTSQVLLTFEKRCSPKPFGQTKNGLVSGRLACTSSKTEILNKIGI